MERLFGEMGIKTITVPEQREPDGAFPTVAFPNPEEPAALKMALDLAKKEKAQLVIGTDPDADRIGIAVPDNQGNFVLLTGNQLGTLMGDYLFLTHKEKSTMPPNPRLVKTIVTTEMQVKVAEKYGAGWYDVLTGFKYIGEKIKEFEATGETYVFGGEESYGFLITPEVRDKDAISAAALTAEMVLYYHSRGMSLLDRLEELWREVGYFEEVLISKTIKGVKGAQIIKEIMADLRADPPAEIGGVDVTEVRDYQNQAVLPVPRAEVIQIRLADDTIVTARPSGTEPKIKFYASLRGRPGESLAEAQADVARRIVGVQAYLATLTNRS
jgi:phosphoglucomutase